MNLSDVPPGNLFTTGEGQTLEVFMRGEQVEPGLFRTHRIYPATGLFEQVGGFQVTEVTVERIQVKAVQD